VSPSPYQSLEARFARLGALQDATAMLQWDTATLMPSGGAAARAEQLATLRLVCHELLTDPAVAELLAAAEAEPALDPWQRANLAEMRRLWVHATAVPADLVEALSKACSASEMRWREARPAGDFTLALPALGRVLELVREAAAAKAERLGKSRYEALLDEYEPGGSEAAIDRLFDALAQVLPRLIDGALQRQAERPPMLPLTGPFPIEAQRKLGLQLMERLGFEFAHGRLDVSLHPFCGGTPDDVRLTTRYDESNFTRALMGVLHETGHALYEAGRPRDWRRQPVGNARGMVLHESQSLLMEMQACRSDAFVAFAAARMREAFGRSGPAWEPDNIHRLYTRVEPGFIRVDADEVTYPLHIMLRYRIERSVLADGLALADLPAAWNDGMKELLGIVPPDDAVGCLQDIHWPDGAWGYFPTYTLGALAAAQLFAAARQAVPDLMGSIGKGDFAPLLGWLRTNVHGKGSLADTDTILSQATGAPLGTAAFKAHLESRYLSA
jgi:carboxypeptidase Taq